MHTESTRVNTPTMQQGESSSHERQVTSLRRLLGLFGLLLIGATRPLWLGAGPLPQIPWFSWGCQIPLFVDVAAIGITCCCLTGFVLLPDRLKLTRPIAILFVLSFGLLLSLDQHRLQPWAWQFFLLGSVIALSNRMNPNWWRWLTASIYLYSAWSKCDTSFLDSHGQMLINGMLTPFNISTEFWAPATKQTLAVLLPLGEAIVGLLLLCRPTYRWGCVGSWGMHLLLLLTLGPLGLNHESGVLLWNVYFLVQNYILFWSNTPDQETEKPAEQHSLSEKTGHCILCMLMFIALLAPLLNNIQRWDHWPAWAVYCSRPAKVEVFLSLAEVDQLPESIKLYVGQPQPFAEEAPLNLDAISFRTRFCPLYPQVRYRLAITLALLEQMSLREESVRVVIQSVPDRWTGERETTVVSGLFELSLLCEEYALNTRPRR